MANRDSRQGQIPSKERWTRRRFLGTVGTGAALSLGAPYIRAAERQSSEHSREEILDEAKSRIRQYRMGRSVLRLQGPNGQGLPVGSKIKIAQTRHKFLFGCNIFKLGRCGTPEQNVVYQNRFAELMNFATVPFYWWNYERRKGQLDDERTEEVVRWCQDHGMTTKGHPLAWNFRDPRWLDGPAQEVMQLQMARIERCVKRFRGNIDIWDVVNEATHYDRETCKRDGPKLTEAISNMGLGPFLRQAFKTAREANPNATLLINDYRTDEAYAQRVISELAGENDHPLYDVVGIQSHMHTNYWGPARTWEVCERFAKFGKPLHFTETTVVSGPKTNDGWTTTTEGEQRQAQYVAEFYTTLFSHPAVEAITWWDFSDQGAWQHAPAGLIRDDMTPKPVYDRLIDLVKNQWWTQAEIEVQPEGKVEFHGFLGDYRISVQVGDRSLIGTFHLKSNSNTPMEVKLA